VASIQPIPDSPWILVAKVDLEEIHRPIKEAARLTAVLVSLLVALVGVIFALVWSRRERENLGRSRLELEEKVQERTSELIRTNEELRFYSKQLEMARQEHEEFTFVAAHDLQEPLRKIQVLSSFLQNKSPGALTDNTTDKLKRLQFAANHMQDLISALLNYSKIAVAPQLFRLISLREVIENAISDLENKIARSKAHIVVEEELPLIEADNMLIKLLFTQLIDNAIKYRGRNRPEINIRGEVDTRSCTIYVEDNGVGFETRYLHVIFRPFQRLQSKDQHGGTGMGLAIVRKIVERHYGTITAKSTPGEGSTFIIKLPLQHGNRMDAFS
jgi:light-regulated signal transduction histidine kinase (bacteriophytochrome)